MRDYSKVGPQFWIGKTGKALRKAGPFAQIVAFYLMTCPHASMLGLYYLTRQSIAHETGLGEEGACKGLIDCIEAGYCSYDDESEMVWVHEMAFYQIADELMASDKRCLGVQNEYNTLPDNPFLDGFFQKYAGPFHMTKNRGAKAPEQQAPSKPLASQEQEHEQEQKQEQAQEQKAAAPKKSKAPAKTSLPEGFCISDRVQSWAFEKRIVNLEAHLEHFVGCCRAKGYTYVDWDEAFMNAVRNNWAKIDNQARASPASPVSHLGKAGQETAAAAQRLMDKFKAEEHG